MNGASRFNFGCFAGGAWRLRRKGRSKWRCDATECKLLRLYGDHTETDGHDFMLDSLDGLCWINEDQLHGAQQ